MGSLQGGTGSATPYEHIWSMLGLLLHRGVAGGCEEGLIVAIITKLQLQKLDDH